MLNSWGLRHALHNFLCPLNRVELSKRERRNLSVKSLALMNIEDSVVPEQRSFDCCYLPCIRILTRRLEAFPKHLWG